MTRLVVDLDQLAGAVDRMRLFQEHLVRTHDAVEQRMRDLQVVWTGDAAVAQGVAQAQWAAAAHEAQEALGVLASIAETAHANYTAAIVTNRRMWTR